MDQAITLFAARGPENLSGRKGGRALRQFYVRYGAQSQAIGSPMMTQDTLFALMTFAFVTSITPGPNNLMLMSSGINFGLVRTIPHMLGVSIGFCIMAVLVGMGIIQIFDAFPISYVVLKVLSVGYLLYLAWKIATAAPLQQADPTADPDQPPAKPLTFLQAALFQWVNPKALAMALTSVTAYAPQPASLAGVVTVAGVFAMVNLPSVGSWTLLGMQMRRFLEDPKKRRLFNIATAGLLVLSLIPILGTQIG